MEPKKCVLHLIQSLGNGGCENMLLRTLPLLQDGFEHHIIALKELGELASRFVEKGIPVTSVYQSSLFDIAGHRRLLSEMRQYAPDIVITYLLHADMIGRLFIQRKISAPVIPFLRTTYNHPKYLIARILEWLTKPLVKQYLANSEAVKDFYIKNIGVQKEKITVIPNGIDVNFYDSIARNENFRKELGVNPEDIAIVCVANFHINKGHKYLLEAFEKVYKQNKKIKLLLVGNGEEEKNLKKQLESYLSKDNILFLGKRNDVPQLLKISDIFVLPTMFEGMSNAIMEAMTSGLAVISTDIWENRELIVNNINGILIQPEDLESIANKINFLIDTKNSRIELGNSAKSRIKKKFGLVNISKQFNDFLIQVKN